MSFCSSSSACTCHVHVGVRKSFSGDQSIHLPLSIPFFLWSVNGLLHLLCCLSVCFCAVILVFFLFVFLYRFLSSSHLEIKAVSFFGHYVFFLFGVLHHTSSAEKWIFAVQILHCVQFRQRGVEKWGRCVVCTRWTSPPLL